MEKSQTLIPLNYFYEQTLFEQEKTKVFNPHWIFIGFTDDVTKPDQYFTFKHFGESIVVKNFDGQLRAFSNVCSHRFSKICLNEKGLGPLQCPYHGWTYDKEGVPYAIPRRKEFSSLEPEKLKLRSYEVEAIGRFIFLRMKPAKQSLKDYLGNNVTFLEKVGSALGNRIDTNVMTIKANWKVVVENTLEEYHVRMVHPESLYKVEIQSSQFNFQGLHSSDQMTFSVKFTDFRKLPDLMQEREWHVEDYVHQLIFPNMTLASAFGTTIAIQQVIPIDAETTCFISHVFAAKLKENENHALVKAFNQSAINFNRQVFEEDRIICESVQEGLKQAHLATGTVSKDEARVLAFEKNYMMIMKEEKQ